jgi:sporulation protein YlmC with PRC-barrel domain
MEKDGYWLGGSGFGYGYPIVGFGYGNDQYGYDQPMSRSTSAVSDYRNVRPGYEIRMLVASATILGQHGQQQPCEDVLTATRDVYKLYVADLHNAGVAMANVPNWQQQQIAAAQPVIGKDANFRSDELLDTDVRNQKNQILGTVKDLVMSPQTGKIAYLVIARGGFLGFDQNYVPIPWEDFRATLNASVIVLDTTKDTMDAAPQVNDDQFKAKVNQYSEKVDTYWKAHSPLEQTPLEQK